MLQPGETITSTEFYRDFILVFGSLGTILRLVYDYDNDSFRVRMEMKL